MSTIKATTLSNLAGSKTVPMDTVAQGSAKAWANFNGTGTVAIRRAFNVSSITDNGTSNYTVNFTNAMADANYTGVAVGSGASYACTTTYTPTTSNLNVVFTNPVAPNADQPYVNVVIFS